MKKNKETERGFLALSARLLRGAEKIGSELTCRRRPWQIYLAAFGLPFMILLLIWTFCGVVFGNKMILAHDQWHQYYPFFLDLQRKLQDGGSLFYTWTNGMGTNFLSMFAYYLASPINFLVGLLPESLSLGFYTFTVMVKISLASLFFAIFLRKLFDRPDFSIVFFSVMYAFCAFICGYYWNAIWLDTVALLPLVALGTVLLLRDQKFILYTVTLALSVFCSYYVGLFTCIFVLLLFICYQICYWDDWSSFGYRLVRIAFFSLLAIGMTALLSLPAFLGLQATSSAQNHFPSEFSLNIVKDKSLLGVIDGMRQILSQLGTGISPTSMEGLPNVACGTVTVALAIAYFCTKKIPLREKLCTAGLLLFFCLSFLIRQLDYIWHGFHFPNMLPYRFSFLFSFVLLFMAYRAFTQINRWRWYHCIYAAPFALLLLFCVFSKQRPIVGVLTTVLLLLTFAALFLFSKRKLSKNLTVLLLCVLLLSEALIGIARGTQKVGFTTGTNYPRCSSDVQQLLDVAKEREANTVDLWRTETTMTQTLNDNALNGYSGISTFSSAANCGVSQFLKGIGLPASVRGNRYSYMETTPLTNLLLGLNYMIDRDELALKRPYFETVSSSGNVKLLKNKAYLPMGYMVSSDVLEYDAEERLSSTRTANQNDIYQLLSGSHADLLHRVELTENSHDEGLSVTGSGSQFHIKKTDSDSSSAQAAFTYRITEPCHFCVYTATSNTKNVSVALNGESTVSYNARYGYLRDFGMLQKGDVLTFSVAPKDNNDSTLTIYACTFDDAAFDALYQQLSAGCVTATAVTDTTFEGQITALDDGICYLSIPYDSGWTATVDGKKTSTLPVFDAFIGLRLTAGSHTLSLRYETPGFRTGLTISYLCLAVFFVLVAITLLRKVLTRPIQQVDMEMLGQPSTKSKKTVQPVQQEAAFLEPIADAPVAPEPVSDAPDTSLSGETQVIPTDALAEENGDPQWEGMLENANELLQDNSTPEAEAKPEQAASGMPVLFDSEPEPSSDDSE